jgi:hypothetical protein
MVVVGTELGRHWLVMFSLAGVLETALVVANAEPYLSQADFDPVGMVSEVPG